MAFWSNGVGYGGQKPAAALVNGPFPAYGKAGFCPLKAQGIRRKDRGPTEPGSGDPVTHLQRDQAAVGRGLGRVCSS